MTQEPQSKVIDDVKQPDENTCQSAAIARVLGTQDVWGVRAELTRGGAVAGDPWNMGRYMAAHVRDYRFLPNASLNDATKALDEGYQLITHGYFTTAGHVIGLSGYEPDPRTLSHRFIAEDPWYEFEFQKWRYSRHDGNDVRYSSYGIYAACVASHGLSHAHQIYKRGELNNSMRNMWLHIIKN